MGNGEAAVDALGGVGREPPVVVALAVEVKRVNLASVDWRMMHCSARMARTPMCRMSISGVNFSDALFLIIELFEFEDVAVKLPAAAPRWYS